VSPPPITVLKGSDPVLLVDAVAALVDELLAGRDRTAHVDELAGDDYECAAIVMAASSVSMFGDRIVVARNAGRFNADEAAPLVTYLQDPNPTSTVVVVWEKPMSATAKPFPKKLGDAVKAAGGVVRDTDAPVQAKQRSAWLEARLGEASVSLTAAARHLVAERVGEDVSRVGGLVAVLDASFPAGTKVDAADVEPFLGDSGSVPPWELTDAIDGGDVATAVDRVQRMIRADRHPLQLMATLQTHYERILRLDGADVRNENEAAALLGMKGSTYPAKKALATSRRLGHDGAAAAIRLLAKADVDLRGASGWPADLVMEVLVGRLARLSRRR
jgi:DNA polymerase-3 subunit delta